MNLTIGNAARAMLATASAPDGAAADAARMKQRWLLLGLIVVLLAVGAVYSFSRKNQAKK